MQGSASVLELELETLGGASWVTSHHQRTTGTRIVRPLVAAFRALRHDSPARRALVGEVGPLTLDTKLMLVKTCEHYRRN